jgi:LEA14-like dessication related protein
LKVAPTLLLFAGGILAYSLFRKSAAGGDLVFFPKGIRALKFEGSTPVLEMNLGIGNTSNQSFTIKAIAGNLYTNGIYIGYVSNFNPVQIPPTSEAILPVSIRMSLIGAVSQLIDGLTNGSWSQDLELDMKTNVDNLVVPVVIKYKIGK